VCRVKEGHNGRDRAAIRAEATENTAGVLEIRADDNYLSASRDRAVIRQQAANTSHGQVLVHYSGAREVGATIDGDLYCNTACSVQPPFLRLVDIYSAARADQRAIVAMNTVHWWMTLLDIETCRRRGTDIRLKKHRVANANEPAITRARRFAIKRPSNASCHINTRWPCLLCVGARLAQKCDTPRTPTHFGRPNVIDCNRA